MQYIYLASLCRCMGVLLLSPAVCLLVSGLWGWIREAGWKGLDWVLLISHGGFEIGNSARYSHVRPPTAPRTHAITKRLIFFICDVLLAF